MLIDRLLVLLILVFSCLFGLKEKRNGFNHKYFDLAICGMVALLLARIYYLVIILSNGTDEIFTVGTLGQASAYMFFLTANLYYLPNNNKKISVISIVSTLAVCGLFLITAIEIDHILAYIGLGIYIISMGSTLYFAINNIVYSKESKECKDVLPFNICVCILILGNALMEFRNILTINGTLSMIIMIIALVISVPAIAVMLPLLRNGVKEWDQ